MEFLQLMILTVCVWGCLSLVPNINYDSDVEWEAWKVEYGKNYSSEKEEVMKRRVWEKNVMMVTKHNLEQQQGFHSYRLGMNAFGDMEHDEITATFNGYRKGRKSRDGSPFLPQENAKLPESLDWRAEGYVTPVKDQLYCGSCWAFSAVGSLEGQHFKSTGKLESLSEQNLVDCSWYEGNEGCNGGHMEFAFQYVIDSGGIESEDSYPYVGKEEDCTFDKSLVAATCKNYSVVDSGEESDLQKAVASVGPISVAIDASQSSFHFYKSGVYDDPQCSSWLLNHGVLVVGYNTTETGQDYWIVKNSWGKDWGDEGYIWMSRNNDNQCGIASDATYPLT